MMKEHDVMNNPVRTLVSINNVTKMEMTAGIDKHTGKEYTTEQLKKAKAGTQLYTTVMMLEKINENMNNPVLNDVSREKINNLTGIIRSTIDNTYGKNTYQRIKDLSAIGPNPTTEQKKESIKLIKEIDSKAQELVLSEEFEKGLQDLIDYQNTAEGKTLKNTGEGLSGDFALKLSYHTHPKTKTEAVHANRHNHGPMNEEEHRLFHEKEKLKENIKGE